AWTQAWAGKNLDAYFALYAPDFMPEGGLGRSAWEAQRRDRISRPKRIGVQAVNPQVTRNGDGLRVSFRQDYESDAFSDQVNKVLELKQVGGTWKIAREYAR
ncbi:MAG TPA: hypothetical protein VLI06_19985, partial [Solimonas sp.]|nr:hypothetical protein [Solimonas sp.]